MLGEDRPFCALMHANGRSDWQSVVVCCMEEGSGRRGDHYNGMSRRGHRGGIKVKTTEEGKCRREGGFVEVRYSGKQKSGMRGNGRLDGIRMIMAITEPKRMQEEEDHSSDNGE